VLHDSLPVESALPALRAALHGTGTAVLVAPPGAGKTTVVPLRLLDEPWIEGRRIVVLEPRRLAARAAARRMAELLGDEVGGTVGYQTRDERRISARTRIEVLTEGVLTRRIQHDPELADTAIVLFDEVHERNLPTDLGLALALDVRRTIRPDLRIVAMSATADAERFSRVLGTPEQPTPVITAEGRTYPIDIRWAPTMPPKGRQQRGRAQRPGPRRAADVVDHVVDTVVRSLRDDTGDVLVFLPGIGEIRRTEAALTERLSGVPGGDLVDVRPLAGALSLHEQDLALEPSPPGRRRVVLSTDIAETSLTVEGVHIVIDAGLARAPRHDPRTGMTRLVTVTTSRASAEQRAGRAGRTAPGVAYRLWSKIEHATRREHLPPEITEVDLAGLALELAVWGNADLSFPDAPPPAALAHAREVLGLLDLIDDGGRITETGRKVAALPLHPRLGRMVVTAPDEPMELLACTVAALLDERDVMRGRLDDLPIDVEYRLRLIAGTTRDDRADRRGLETVRQRARDIARRAGVRGDPGDIDDGLIARCGLVLLSAYPDRVAVRRQPGQLQLRSGQAAWIPADDPLAHEAFVVAADLDGNRSNARVRLAAAVSTDDVARALADDLTTERSITFDRDRGDLVERVERRIGRMRLGDETRSPEPSAEATTALLGCIAGRRLIDLPWTPAATALRARVRFLARELGAPWPDWSDTALTATLDTWLGPFLGKATTIADLGRIDLVPVLRSQLPWPLGAELDDLAPTHLVVASGRRVALDYEGAVDADSPPVLSVRVQEVFGTTEHPSVCAGRVPVVVALLSPADRPIQITSDLPGFWSGSWSEVRKDMAGRYPKHDWPVDPTAPERPR
jgi:ATP-dependent helicase HrpB